MLLDQNALYKGLVTEREDEKFELNILLGSEGTGTAAEESTIIVFLNRQCNPNDLYVIRINGNTLMKLNSKNDYLSNKGLYKVQVNEYFIVEHTNQIVMFLTFKAKSIKNHFNKTKEGGA